MLQSMKFSLNVQNPFTLTGYTGYDPEVGLNGVYSGGYPRLRKYTFGLDLTF